MVIILFFFLQKLCRRDFRESAALNTCVKGIYDPFYRVQVLKTNHKTLEVTGEDIFNHLNELT